LAVTPLVTIDGTGAGKTGLLTVNATGLTGSGSTTTLSLPSISVANTQVLANSPSAGAVNVLQGFGTSSAGSVLQVVPGAGTLGLGLAVPPSGGNTGNAISGITNTGNVVGSTLNGVNGLVPGLLGKLGH